MSQSLVTMAKSMTNMTTEQIKVLSEALEKCKEDINRSFDKFIDEIKQYGN